MATLTFTVEVEEIEQDRIAIIIPVVLHQHEGVDELPGAAAFIGNRREFVFCHDLFVFPQHDTNYIQMSDSKPLLLSYRHTAKGCLVKPTTVLDDRCTPDFR